MATSERLQIQKLKNSEPGQQKFALILFEDEERYSVVDVDRIKERHFACHQVVNIWWGKGKEAKYFPAKLLKCGTQEDCEKAALELSFSQDISDKESDHEDPQLTPKRKRDDETFLPRKRNETDDSPDALWKGKNLICIPNWHNGKGTVDFQQDWFRNVTHNHYNFRENKCILFL
ncbi:uncharacterized protein [Acropora muricata]|uniref:uncharacterized protein isoform X2 n=1 Tax=Acropora muricata TaxID=159855 RepID=UPI0034E55DDC